MSNPTLGVCSQHVYLGRYGKFLKLIQSLFTIWKNMLLVADNAPYYHKIEIGLRVSELCNQPIDN